MQCISALMEHTKKERIIELLSENTDGHTVIEISRVLGVSRNTAPVILAELKGEGKIRIRNVGKAKLHYLNN